MSITAQDETEHSQPHRRIERILDKMKIAYMSEERFPPYSVDIYINEWHIGIEVDGPAHSAKKDTIRDDILRERYFLPILRLKTSEHPNYNSIVHKIEDFIIEWSKTGEQRKHQYVMAL